VFGRASHDVDLGDVGRGDYRICVERNGGAKYVAWKAWEGFILVDDATLACPFKTAKVARKIGREWTHAGRVFVERASQFPA
jgi:hypothetical protein